MFPSMFRYFGRTSRLLAVGATLAGAAGTAAQSSADGFCPPGWQKYSYDCPTDSTAQPGASTPETAAPSAATSADESAFGELGGFGRSYLSTGIAVAGTGLASASATGGGNTFTNVNVPNSALSPGFLTSATVQPTMPMNRVFGGYSLFNQFQVQTLTIVDNGPNNPTILAGHRPGFDLNYFNIGIEKTIFNGNASIYVSVPFLSASENTTGQTFPNDPGITVGQNVNGLGNVSFGFKALLLQSEDCCNALSGGLTVAAPTAQPGQVALTQGFITPVNPGGPFQFDPNGNNTFRTVNPTFIQPWISGMISGERFYAQNYFGVLIPTSDFVTSVNENLAVGYRLFTTPESFTITPFLNTQVLVPLGGSGISFSTQTFLTEGVQFGLGPCTSLFAGVVEPVCGPQAFTVGGTFGFNFFY